MDIPAKIKELAHAGLRQCEIVKQLNVNRSQVRYHFSEKRRQYLMKQSNIHKKKRRIERMALLREEAGGKCHDCGYDRCSAALHFHHKDPNQKRFHISQFTGRYSLQKLRTEVKKCVLLCANCHIEQTHPDKCED